MIANDTSTLFQRRSTRVLFLGAGHFAALAAQEIEARPDLHYKIVGVVEEDALELPAQLNNYPRVGVPADLSRIVADLQPERIVVALADRRGRLPALDLLEHQLRGVIVEEAVEVYESLSGKLAIENLQPGNQLFRDRFRASIFQDWMSRAISFTAGLVGLIALAPVMALIALAVKLSSDGPVLFRQERIGLHGRPFELLKFRTMRSASSTASQWVADNANRITTVGKWLRRLRLDELAQFVNLLRGDMNLVGPRPHPVSNFRLFTQEIPFYSLRCLVRPGLTGWAQIRYRYANNLAEETEKMRYDLYYIKHRSPWLDLQIIPATLRAVFLGKGASVEESAPESKPKERAMSRELVLSPPVPTPFNSRSVEERCGLDWIPGAAVLRWGTTQLLAGTGAAVARVANTGARVASTVVKSGKFVAERGARVAAGTTKALVAPSSRALVIINR